MHLNTNQALQCKVGFLQLELFTGLLSCLPVLSQQCSLRCHLGGLLDRFITDYN